MNDLNKLTQTYGDVAIDKSTGELKSYIRLDLLYINGIRKILRDIKSYPILITRNINKEYQIFFKELIKYEKENAYKYKNPKSGKKKYKTIYGVHLDILLPRKLKLKADIRTFVNKFMSLVNPIGYNIPWIAYEVKRGDARYINILLSERECIEHEEYIYYDRNYKLKTGEIVHAKGDIKMDSKGNKRKKTVQFSNKTRLFILDRPFEQLRNKLFQHFKIAAIKIVRDIKIRFFLRVKSARKGWHFFNKQCVLEVNHAKRYIEYMCNRAVDIQRESVLDYIHNDYIKNVPTPKYREIEAVFMKYKKRFDKNEFHDDSNVVRAIGYKNVALDDLKANIKDLILLFDTEIKKIVPSI
ncbi:MAG: hypothetical protein RR623_08630 [Bacilli bacterium]